MSGKPPLQRWREREPEGWSWAPRPGAWWAALRRRGGYGLAHGYGALRFAVRALLNIDRWNWQRIAELGRAVVRRLREAALWIPRRYTAILGVVAVALTPIWLWLIWDLFREVTSLVDALGTETGAEDRRNIAYALGVTTAALAGLVAAPLVLIRAWVAERHTRTAEEGLITERFTRAVEQLGAEKTVRRRSREVTWRRAGDPLDEPTGRITEIEGEPPAIPDDAGSVARGEWQAFERSEPNLEVRLGAIYALERIAQDSERDHIPIMETLAAYVRENAPARLAKDHGLGERPEWPAGGDGDAIRAHRRAMGVREGSLRGWVWRLPAPRVDVRAALSVIGRRGAERIAHERRRRTGDRDHGPGFRLDLRGANLQGADLARAALDHALLTGSRLEGADLFVARLEGADLRGARLERAVLVGARLEGADLTRARLEGAVLVGARLEGADLTGARLEGAVLVGTRLEGAVFVGARLEGAFFGDARLERANLRGAKLSGAEGLTQQQVNAAFGDSATTLPEGIGMPDHWDDEPFRGPHSMDTRYRAWLDAGAPAGKPRADRA